MAEIELSALSKQCLDRRIDKMIVLSSQVMSWTKRHNHLKVVINWNLQRTILEINLTGFYDTIMN